VGRPAGVEQNPKALRIACKVLDIFIVRDALDEADCRRLIRLIDRNRIPSGLLSPTSDPEFRTSESCNLDSRNPAVKKVEAKIAGIMGIDLDLGETIQGQRYALGQQFKAITTSSTRMPIIGRRWCAAAASARGRRWPS